MRAAIFVEEDRLHRPSRAHGFPRPAPERSSIAGRRQRQEQGSSPCQRLDAPEHGEALRSGSLILSVDDEEMAAGRMSHGYHTLLHLQVSTGVPPARYPIPTMPPILAIVGPTATGKSELGMALAEALGGEIVNADALQVYRGLDIGTAKPSPADRERVPHHLIDILEPQEVYSAGDFARRAQEVITDIQGRGRMPVVVGGSGLYLRALFAGISPIPPGDPGVRQELRERLAAEGLASLREELARLDPPTAARLSAGDTQRILRALEVARVTGRPLSAWISEQPFGTQAIAAVRVGLTLPRAILYDRIAGRVARMLDAGWLEEVGELLRLGLSPRLPAFQAIGYRQLVRHLEGDGSLEQAIAEILKETRRFAKRQETWFRKEPDVTWFSAQELKRQIPGVLEHAKHRGLGRAYG